MSSDFAFWVEECISKAPVLSQLADFSDDQDMIRRWTRRHYAEVRTFIDLKLPERLRICPHEAVTAKQFFATLYLEEQGHFRSGRNHAQIFATFAEAIGISHAELTSEYDGYRPNFDYMRALEPSIENLVVELATSYAWESAMNSLVVPLGKVLEQVTYRYTIKEHALQYFTEHLSIDKAHAEAAYNTLREYAIGNELEQLARTAIEDTLISQNPWTLQLTRPIE